MKYYLVIVAFMSIQISCNNKADRKNIMGHWIISTHKMYYEIYSKGESGYYIFDGETGHCIEELNRPLFYRKSSDELASRGQASNYEEEKVFSEVLGIKDSIIVVEIPFEITLSLDSFKIGSNRRFMEWLGIDNSDVETWEEIEYDLEMH